MAIPGFTAEQSLAQSNARYRGAATYHGTAMLAPQLSRVCSDCSGFLRGTRYCCDIRITCNPWGGCTVFQLCETEQCGLLPWLESVFARSLN